MTHHTIQAFAYDRKHANKRPIFSMTQDIIAGDAGDWVSSRKWYAVGDEAIMEEQFQWDASLQKAKTMTKSFDETGHVTCNHHDDRHVHQTKLQSARTQNQTRERVLTTSHAPVTLASMPLFVASHWQDLMQGQTVLASYLVLKVQRAATLKIQYDQAFSDAKEIKIDVIPTNPLLRMIFGSNSLFFSQDTMPKLIRSEGLLDPRDKKHSGRWHEYFGRIEYSEPWDLSPFVQER